MTTVYNIEPGAKAYSPDGEREWGNAPAYKDVTIVAWGINGNMARIDTPRWANGKRWCVREAYIEKVEENPEPPVPPTTNQVIIAANAMVYTNAEGTRFSNPEELVLVED